MFVMRAWAEVSIRLYEDAFIDEVLATMLR